MPTNAEAHCVLTESISSSTWANVGRFGSDEKTLRFPSNNSASRTLPQRRDSL